MAQTRMFRDRVVSMEQTLEGGEKHLELLKALCSEAIPDFAYTGHVLDHERDLFVLELQALDGRKKTVAFTRMVLYDAERIPAIVESPSAPVREKLVLFLRSRMARPEIVVTFRHIEDGFVDTPEPRPSRRRGRRGGRGKGPTFAKSPTRQSRYGDGAAPAGRPGFPPAPPGGKGRPGQRPGGDRRPHTGPAPARPASSPLPAGRPGGPPPQGGGVAAVPGGAPGRSGRRRRSRRRRRGGSGGPGGGAPAGNPQGAP